MKKTFFTFAVLLPLAVFSQNAIFLHHSTGGGVWGGGVAAWITNYNTAHSTSYQATELNYPNTPYPWENYPYDFWNLWCNSACNSADPDIECLNTLTAKYKLIIIKHCYPGAGIGADGGTSSVSSSSKTLGNYKLQYRALRAKFDSFPANKFMVWTLAPLHRLATNTADAARAKQFVDWVKTEWLTEDGKSHPNIYIFDFFGYAAELNPTPANGQVNCLKYDYEGSHTGSDSHPNSTANTTIAPFFGQAIVDALKDTTTTNYTVTFMLKEGTTAVSGASVTFNSQTLSSDVSGKVVFNNVNAGNALSYSIVKTGYNTFNGSAGVAKDTTIAVNLVKTGAATYAVTFLVKEGSALVSGAKVTFNSQNVNTGAAGTAVFTGVPKGTPLSYSVSKSSYTTVSSSATISKDTTINISLVKTIALGKESSEINVFPNPATEQVTIAANEVIGSVKLVSLTGTIVKEWSQINSDKAVLLINDVPGGYYLVSIIPIDGNSLIKPLIIK